MQSTTAARELQDEDATGGTYPVPASVLMRKLSHVNDERVTDICDCVMDLVAALFSISGRELRAPGRSSAGVTRVRQIAMYVSHVTLRLSMKEIGIGFGRDRTTVRHACHLIEDMREDEDFDNIVHMTERVTAAAFRNTEVLR